MTEPPWLLPLLAALPVGVLVEDAQRRVVHVNDALGRLLGHPSAGVQVVGLPVTAALGALVPSPRDAAALLRRRGAVGAGRWPGSGERIALSDGRELAVDVRPCDGGAVWLVCERTCAATPAAQDHGARDAVSGATARFLGAVSHEIRTPMHGVLATLELLATTPLDAEQRELLDVASSSAATLVRLIDDILDLQRAEADRLELRSEPFEPARVAREAVAMLRGRALARGLELRLVVDPDDPPAVVGDGLRLQQVLVNLVGNAVKYTEHGTVTVALGASRRADDVLLDVEVRDTGPGIPADRLPSVFDPFVRGRSDPDGSGLGLSVTERLVALMGGRITVASTEGEGSTFRVRLALPEADAVTHRRQDEVRPAPAVLVVDDAPASRDLVVRQLARLGVESVSASSGEQALRILESGRSVGLVLLDADMPGLDGPATCLAIRACADLRAASVPVVALVAGGDDALERCRASGMDGYVDKPVDPRHLRRVVDAFLASREDGPTGPAG